MPIVEVHLLKGRTLDQKRRLVQEMTRVLCETLAVKPEQVRILLSEMEKEDYAIGGILSKDRETGSHG